MPSTLNMESSVKPSSSPIHDASSYPQTVSAAVVKPQKCITGAVGGSSCSTWKRGLRFVTKITWVSTMIRRWAKNTGGCTIPCRSGHCQNYQKKPMETIKPVKEVPFKLAGAKMKATMGMIEGTFHPIPLDLWNAIKRLAKFKRGATIRHATSTKPKPVTK